MSEQGNFPQQRQNRPESEIVRKFLDNQEKEIEVKRREVEISAIQDGNQKEVALASIAAQKDDLSKVLLD